MYSLVLWVFICSRPDYRRAEDLLKLVIAVYYICYQNGGEDLCSLSRVHTDMVFQDTEARHRYSEFESLRANLVKLYPTLIIPPIPSKQTIGDYAVKQAKAKEDAAMIAKRKRMLQTFLNRIARHPILSNEHVFHRFLDGEVSWVGIAPLNTLHLFDLLYRRRSSTHHP